ncbi:MAG TPA: histidine kinase dimerization/phospho-acceptor domain-containing protein, partial [Solirubrobacterales bacterium]
MASADQISRPQSVTPRFGMRLWLTGAFAAVSLITAATVYVFGDNHQALLAAVLIGVLAGFLIAVAISHRVVILARAAGEMAKGSFDAPLNTSGVDEIADLARSLDAMRASLQESFGVLTADRNKLAAIFDGLTDAVIVVDYEGPVRFSNSAAGRLLGKGGEPPEVVEPQLRRAAEVGFAAHPALRIGDRAYAMTARALPNERAVLAVLRDRTDELRRELAEADFISNAAHELRNPLAGMSGAIEVLQSGAKNNPLDRDHFLNRLADDAERMKALTQSLLTLARVESRGAAENEVVDVAIAVRDVVAAVEPPPRIELVVDVEQDLAAT